MRSDEVFLRPETEVLRLGDEILFCAPFALDPIVVLTPCTSELLQGISHAVRNDRRIDDRLDSTLVSALQDNGAATNAKSLGARAALPGFVPFRLECGDWCVRCAEELYVFHDEGTHSLVRNYRRIVRTWGHDDHRRIGTGVLAGKATFLAPALFESATVNSLLRLERSPKLFRRLRIVQDAAKPVVHVIEQMPPDIRSGIASIARQDKEDALLILVPTVFSTADLPAKPVLASCAVFSRHRSVSEDELPPMQVGRGPSTEVAARLAIAESIERLCGQTPPDDVRRGCTAAELGNVLPMSHFPLLSGHAGDAYGVVPFDAALRLDWVEVVSFEGERAWAPTDLVYYGSGVAPRGGSPVFYTSSSGTAAHVSVDAARRGALEELIERDALMLYWASKVTPPSTSRSCLPALAQKAVEIMEGLGFDILLRNLTLDLLPVGLAIAVNRQQHSPYFLCGAGCAGSLDEALGKAVRELETLLWHSLDLRTDSPISAVEVRNPIDHARFYCDPLNAHHVAFLLAESVCQPSRGVRFKDLGATPVEEFLAARGIKTYFRDITTDEVRHATQLSVFRAIATELVPITFGYRAEVTVGNRLRHVAPGQVDADTPPMAPHFFS